MKNKPTTLRAKFAWSLLMSAGISGLCMLVLCITMIFASNNKKFATFFLNHVFEFTVLFLLIFAVLTILVFLMLIKDKIKYLEEIRINLDKIADDNFDVCIPVKTTDELGTMAQTVNDMVSKLKQSREDERAMEKERYALITNISHDLRTPLTSILGYLQLIDSNQLMDREKLSNYSNTALNQCNNLKSLIDDLFEYTKLSNTNIKPSMMQINLAELLEQVLLGFIPAFQDAGMEYRLFFANCKVMLNADPMLLTRAFDNLIRNAILYGNKGKYIDIRLNQEDTATIVQIIDYGKQIPAADLEHIFERLYRAEQASTISSGAGLGLAIVKSVIELHNGSVKATSSETETIFEVYLPRI